jgi:hypothetical protein
VVAHTRARARLLDGCPSALVRFLSYTAHARWGSVPPQARSGRLTNFDRICFDERPGSALSVRVAGPTRGSSRAGPNMRYEPLAHARRHTAFGAPESGRLLELRCARDPPPARARLTLLPAGPPGAHASSSRLPIDGVHWYLTIRWSRRGGPPPYRGQSNALAAPQLSSSVRKTAFP